LNRDAAEATALRKLTAGVSPSSAKVYASHIKRFKRWCAGVQGLHWPPSMSAIHSYELSLLADGAYPSNAQNAARVSARFLQLLEETDSYLDRSAGAPEVSHEREAGISPTAHGAPVEPGTMSPDELILASLGLSFDSTDARPTAQFARPQRADEEIANESPNLQSEGARHVAALQQGLQQLLRHVERSEQILSRWSA
jgi:hypothetical protein